MTHRHTLLKIPIILITITLALAVLTGCQNIFNRIPEPTAKYGKITVKVDLGEPSQNARFIQDDSTQDDRSAMPSTFDGAAYVFAGVVHDSSTTVTASMLKIAESVTPDAKKEKLTIVIPFELSASDRNNYTLSIYAFKSGTTSITNLNNVIFYGTTSITIPAEAKEPSSVGSVKLVPQTFPSDINGKINLKIGVPKGYTLSAKCNTSGHSASSCGFNFTKDTALSNTSSDFYTFTESNTSAGIVSGEHDVVFTVQKSSTPVYLWTEIITVYPYLTTNKWINGLDDSNGTRVITESQFYSTFYVSGTSPSVFTASGNDSTGDGSVAKPFATVQKALDKVLAMNNGAAGESYTIFVDGTVAASSDGTVVNFTSIGSTPANISIIGLDSASKATLKGNRSSISGSRNSVIIIPESTSLNLTLDNLMITDGAAPTSGGAGIRIGSGTITVNNCELSYNMADGCDGGGIYNNGGTVSITSCTINGNVADNGNGEAIYNNGTLNLSGNLQVDDIYLPAGKFITISDNLSESAVVRISLDAGNASATPPTTSQYVIGTKVLQAATEALITNNIGKFILNAPNDPTTAYKDFYLTPDNTGKNAVLAQSKVGLSVGLVVGEYTFMVLKNGVELQPNALLLAGDELSFKVYNSSNVEVTNATNCKIAVKQNGDEIPSLTKSGANVSAVKVTIPQSLAEIDGVVDVFVSAMIDGVTYDLSVKGVRVTTYAEVAVGDLSTYLSTHTGQVAVTVQADTDADVDEIKAALCGIGVTVTGVDLKLTGSVTSIESWAFSGCSLLTSVEIPNSVTSIGGYAFRECTLLTSIEIPSSVTSIGIEAFEYCSSLASVEIPSSVTSIGSYAFSDCSSLTSVEIPGSVTSISDFVFDGCSSLASVEIPSSVTSIGNGAFSGCSSLVSIAIPNSVTSIGSWAFSRCSSLASIEIPSRMTSINNDAFEYCSSLVSIAVDESNSNYSSENGVLFNKAKTQLICYPAGKTEPFYSIPSSVTSIGSYAFSSCSLLTSVEIPSGVTSIGGYAFYGCSLLTSIEIPSGVTSIGYSVFESCSSLASVVIPSSVTSIGYRVFSYCSRLTSVKFLNTSNWYADSSSALDYTELIDVTNESTNATNLKRDSGAWSSKYLHKKPATP